MLGFLSFLIPKVIRQNATMILLKKQIKKSSNLSAYESATSAITENTTMALEKAYHLL